MFNFKLFRNKKISIFLCFTFFVNLFFNYNLVATDVSAFNYSLPMNIGKVVDRFDGMKGEKVFLIEDLHCHPVVEEKIDKILTWIKTNYKDDFNFIGLEGTKKEEINFDRFKGIDKKSLESLGKDLINLGLINGADFYAMRNKIKVYGIEEEKIYLNSLKRLYESILYREKLESLRINLENAYTRNEGYFFNDKMKEVLLKKQDNRTGKISFIEYLKFLKSKTDTFNYDEINRVLELDEIEKTLDIVGARIEAKTVLEKLDKYIEKEEKEKLNLEEGDKFYVLLSICLDKKNIDISKNYKKLISYINYIKQRKLIDDLALVEEIEKLEQEVIRKECGILGDGVEFLSEMERMRLFFKYIKNEASTQDVEEYEKGFRDFDVYSKKVFYKDYLTDFSEDIRKSSQNMSTFYKYASKRNEIMTNNLLNNRDRSKVSAILVGGYHARGIKEFLRARGISYEVILPIVEDYDGKIYYEDRIIEEAKRLGLSEGLIKKNFLGNDKLSLIDVFSSSGIFSEEILGLEGKALENKLIEIINRRENFDKVNNALYKYNQAKDILREKAEKNGEKEEFEKLEKELDKNIGLGEKKGFFSRIIGVINELFKYTESFASFVGNPLNFIIDNKEGKLEIYVKDQINEKLEINEKYTKSLRKIMETIKGNNKFDDFIQNFFVINDAKFNMNSYELKNGKNKDDKKIFFYISSYVYEFIHFVLYKEKCNKDGKLNKLTTVKDEDKELIKDLLNTFIDHEDKENKKFHEFYIRLENLENSFEREEREKGEKRRQLIDEIYDEIEKEGVFVPVVFANVQGKSFDSARETLYKLAHWVILSDYKEVDIYQYLQNICFTEILPFFCKKGMKEEFRINEFIEDIKKINNKYLKPIKGKTSTKENLLDIVLIYLLCLRCKSLCEDLTINEIQEILLFMKYYKGNNFCEEIQEIYEKSKSDNISGEYVNQLYKKFEAIIEKGKIKHVKEFMKDIEIRSIDYYLNNIVNILKTGNTKGENQKKLLDENIGKLLVILDKDKMKTEKGREEKMKAFITGEQIKELDEKTKIVQEVGKGKGKEIKISKEDFLVKNLKKILDLYKEQSYEGKIKENIKKVYTDVWNYACFSKIDLSDEYVNLLNNLTSPVDLEKLKDKKNIVNEYEYEVIEKEKGEGEIEREIEEEEPEHHTPGTSKKIDKIDFKWILNEDEKNKQEKQGEVKKLFAKRLYLLALYKKAVEILEHVNNRHTEEKQQNIITKILKKIYSFFYSVSDNIGDRDNEDYNKLNNLGKNILRDSDGINEKNNNVEYLIEKIPVEFDLKDRYEILENLINEINDEKLNFFDHYKKQNSLFKSLKNKEKSLFDSLNNEENKNILDIYNKNKRINTIKTLEEKIYRKLDLIYSSEKEPIGKKDERNKRIQSVEEGDIIPIRESILSIKENNNDNDEIEENNKNIKNELEGYNQVNDIYEKEKVEENENRNLFPTENIIILEGKKPEEKKSEEKKPEGKESEEKENSSQNNIKEECYVENKSEMNPNINKREEINNIESQNENDFDHDKKEFVDMSIIDRLIQIFSLDINFNEKEVLENIIETYLEEIKKKEGEKEEKHVNVKEFMIMEMSKNSAFSNLNLDKASKNMSLIFLMLYFYEQYVGFKNIKQESFINVKAVREKSYNKNFIINLLVKEKEVDDKIDLVGSKFRKEFLDIIIWMLKSKESDLDFKKIKEKFKELKNTMMAFELRVIDIIESGSLWKKEQLSLNDINFETKVAVVEDNNINNEIINTKNQKKTDTNNKELQKQNVNLKESKIEKLFEKMNKPKNDKLKLFVSDTGDNNTNSSPINITIKNRNVNIGVDSVLELYRHDNKFLLKIRNLNEFSGKKKGEMSQMQIDIPRYNNNGRFSFTKINKLSGDKNLEDVFITDIDDILNVFREIQKSKFKDNLYLLDLIKLEDIFKEKEEKNGINKESEIINNNELREEKKEQIKDDDLDKLEKSLKLLKKFNEKFKNYTNFFRVSDIDIRRYIFKVLSSFLKIDEKYSDEMFEIYEKLLGTKGATQERELAKTFAIFMCICNKDKFVVYDAFKDKKDLIKTLKYIKENFGDGESEKYDKHFLEMIIDIFDSTRITLDRIGSKLDKFKKENKKGNDISGVILPGRKEEIIKKEKTYEQFFDMIRDTFESFYRQEGEAKISNNIESDKYVVSFFFSKLLLIFLNRNVSVDGVDYLDEENVELIKNINDLKSNIGNNHGFGMTNERVYGDLSKTFRDVLIDVLKDEQEFCNNEIQKTKLTRYWQQQKVFNIFRVQNINRESASQLAFFKDENKENKFAENAIVRIFGFFMLFLYEKKFNYLTDLTNGESMKRMTLYDFQHNINHILDFFDEELLMIQNSDKSDTERYFRKKLICIEKLIFQDKIKNFKELEKYLRSDVKDLQNIFKDVQKQLDKKIEDRTKEGVKGHDNDNIKKSKNDNTFYLEGIIENSNKNRDTNINININNNLINSNLYQYKKRAINELVKSKDEKEEEEKGNINQEGYIDYFNNFEGNYSIESNYFIGHGGNLFKEGVKYSNNDNLISKMRKLFKGFLDKFTNLMKKLIEELNDNKIKNKMSKINEGFIKNFKEKIQVGNLNIVEIDELNLSSKKDEKAGIKYNMTEKMAFVLDMIMDENKDEKTREYLMEVFLHENIEILSDDHDFSLEYSGDFQKFLSNLFNEKKFKEHLDKLLNLDKQDKISEKDIENITESVSYIVERFNKNGVGLKLTISGVYNKFPKIKSNLIKSVVNKEELKEVVIDVNGKDLVEVKGILRKLGLENKYKLKIILVGDIKDKDNLAKYLETLDNINNPFIEIDAVLGKELLVAMRNNEALYKKYKNIVSAVTVLGNGYILSTKGINNDLYNDIEKILKEKNISINEKNIARSINSGFFGEKDFEHIYNKFINNNNTDKDLKDNIRQFVIGLEKVLGDKKVLEKIINNGSDEKIKMLTVSDNGLVLSKSIAMDEFENLNFIEGKDNTKVECINILGKEKIILEGLEGKDYNMLKFGIAIKAKCIRFLSKIGLSKAIDRQKIALSDNVRSFASAA